MSSDHHLPREAVQVLILSVCLLHRTYGFNVTGGTIGDFTATAQLTKPDDVAANNFDTAPLRVFGPVDVAINITATPFSQVVGSTFTYTVNM